MVVEGDTLVQLSFHVNAPAGAVAKLEANELRSKKKDTVQR